MSTHIRLSILSISLILLAACSSDQAPPSAMAFPPVPVQTGAAVTETVPIELQSVGSAEPFASVEVKAQISGPLMSVRFTEGANVNQGDLLFEIDPRPYREALRQAEAEVARATAQLRQAEATLARNQAQLRNARADADRVERLAAEGVSTRAQEDQIRTAAEMAEQSVRASEAEVESIRAGLEAARAAVEKAKLDLSYCEIRAPISGRVGNLLLHPGNLVSANGDDPLVVINQVSPIFVSFGVPERYLGEIAARQRAEKLTVQAALDKTSGRTFSGTLSVIDNTVDPATGTIRLKAVFDNREGALWPGQFVNVALTLQTQTATVVPSQTVQVGQQGSFVYVVKPDQTVELRPVTVGQTVSDKVIIEEGVSAGEIVVTDGQSRLFPGATIQTSGS